MHSRYRPHKIALPFLPDHGVSQIGGRRKSFDTSACPAKSRSTARPLTNGDANPSPSCFRPFLKARSAMQASSAARARSGSWPGFCMMERITAKTFTAPLESNAGPAAAGRARCAASIMTRQAANENLMRSGNLRSDVRFHVDGNRASRPEEMRLFRRRRHHGVGADNIRKHGVRKPLGELLRPFRNQSRSRDHDTGRWMRRPNSRRRAPGSARRKFQS